MSIITYNKGKGIFWIRFFGIGFIVKNTNIVPLIFSERNGYNKSIKVGKFYIRYLKKVAN
jgi:hypothetical protein